MRKFALRVYFVVLPILVLMAAALVARAYDTTWITSGAKITSANLKADLDEAQSRLVALETPNSTRVYRSTVQSIPDNTATKVQFDTERFDYGDQWTAASNTRLTAKAAGVYLIGACVEMQTNGTGSRSISILFNGGTSIGVQLMPPNSLNTHYQCINTAYSLAQNDYVELSVLQFSGGPLELRATGNFSPEFWMHKLR